MKSLKISYDLIQTLSLIENAFLVHGLKIDTETNSKLPYAWVEVGDYVLDYADDLDRSMRKENYYKHNGICPDTCIKFTPVQAQTWAAHKEFWEAERLNVMSAHQTDLEKMIA